MTTLILGNISFDDNIATIHEVLGIIECETKKEAEKLGEELCNVLTAYVIPTMYKGEIVLEDSMSTLGQCVKKILEE